MKRPPESLLDRTGVGLDRERLRVLVALQGGLWDLIHERGHGDAPVLGLVVEKANKVTFDPGRIVAILGHFLSNFELKRAADI